MLKFLILFTPIAAIITKCQVQFGALTIVLVVGESLQSWKTVKIKAALSLNRGTFTQVSQIALDSLSKIVPEYGNGTHYPLAQELRHGHKAKQYAYHRKEER